MWEGNAPCGRNGAFPITPLGGPEDRSGARCLVSMDEAGGAVEGDLKALVDCGAKKSRDGGVWYLQPVTSGDLSGSPEGDSVLKAEVASGAFPGDIGGV